jgi:hypothetical protein
MNELNFHKSKSNARRIHQRSKTETYKNPKIEI